MKAPLREASGSQLAGSVVRESLTFSDHDVEDMSGWDVPRVQAWLRSIGLAEFEDAFAAHQITGDVLPVLTVDELREMGIATIGPRTYLMKCLKKLKVAYLQKKRNEEKWRGFEERYGCCIPLDCLFDHLINCCMPDPADKYVISGSQLKLTHKVYPMGRLFRVCSRGQRLDTVDFSVIKDVDAASDQNCCGGKDKVFVLGARTQRRTRAPLRAASLAYPRRPTGADPSLAPRASQRRISRTRWWSSWEAGPRSSR